MDIKSLPQNVQKQLRNGVNINNTIQCVKELVFNSLDAKSTSIAVRINLATFRIQIVDNGCGITQSNMNLVGIPYMTSKCRSLSDLKRIKLFGFRGEALSSIRNLSQKITITSRPCGVQNTYSKTFENGKWSPVETVRTRPSQGTTVTVEGFLHNLPVRQKRVNQNIDLNEIKRSLECLAVIHPSVSFNLRNDVTGKVVFHTNKTGSVSQTLVNLFTDISITDLLDIKVSKGKISVSGLVYKKPLSNKKVQFIYLNKRPIFSQRLQNLINSLLLKSLIFQNRQEKREHPAYMINIRCPYSDVDLIASPSKQTVEFKRWDTIIKCVEKAITKLLEQGNLLDCNSKLDQPGQPVPNHCPSMYGVSQIQGAVRSATAKREVDVEANKQMNSSCESDESVCRESIRSNSHKSNEHEKPTVAKRCSFRKRKIENINTTAGESRKQALKYQSAFANIKSLLCDQEKKHKGKRQNAKEKNSRTIRKSWLPLSNHENDNLFKKPVEIKTRLKKIKTGKNRSNRNGSEVKERFCNEERKCSLFEKHANTQSLVLNSELNTELENKSYLNSTVNPDILQNEDIGKKLIMDMFLKATLLYPNEEPEFRNDNKTIQTLVVETTKKNVIAKHKNSIATMTMSVQVTSKKTVMANSVFDLNPPNDELIVDHKANKVIPFNNTAKLENKPSEKMSKCVQTSMFEHHQKEFKIDLNYITKQKCDSSLKLSLADTQPKYQDYNVTFSKYFKKSYQEEGKKCDFFIIDGNKSLRLGDDLRSKSFDFNPNYRTVVHFGDSAFSGIKVPHFGNIEHFKPKMATVVHENRFEKYFHDNFNNSDASCKRFYNDVSKTLKDFGFLQKINNAKHSDFTIPIYQNYKPTRCDYNNNGWWLPNAAKQQYTFNRPRNYNYLMSTTIEEVYRSIFDSFHQKPGCPKNRFQRSLFAGELKIPKHFGNKCKTKCYSPYFQRKITNPKGRKKINNLSLFTEKYKDHVPKHFFEATENEQKRKKPAKKVLNSNKSALNPRQDVSFELSKLNNDFSLVSQPTSIERDYWKITTNGYDMFGQDKNAVRDLTNKYEKLNFPNLQISGINENFTLPNLNSDNDLQLAIQTTSAEPGQCKTTKNDQMFNSKDKDQKRKTLHYLMPKNKEINFPAFSKHAQDASFTLPKPNSDNDFSLVFLPSSVKRDQRKATKNNLNIVSTNSISNGKYKDGNKEALSHLTHKREEMNFPAFTKNVWGPHCQPSNFTTDNHHKAKQSLKKFVTYPQIKPKTSNFLRAISDGNRPADVEIFCKKPLKEFNISFKNETSKPAPQPTFECPLDESRITQMEFNFTTPRINESGSRANEPTEKITMIGDDDDAESVCSKNFAPLLSSTRCLADRPSPNQDKKGCGNSDVIDETLGKNLDHFFVPSLHCPTQPDHQRSVKDSKSPQIPDSIIKSHPINNQSIHADVTNKSKLFKCGTNNPSCEIIDKWSSIETDKGTKQNISVFPTPTKNTPAKQNCHNKNHMEDDWMTKFNEFGDIFYVHKRTGMTSYHAPKQDLQFNLAKRMEFVPKGLSPILVKTEVFSATLSPESKKSLHAAIMKSFENELHTIKWTNYLHDFEDVNQFFEELYKEKRKEFNNLYPQNANVKELPRTMIKLYDNVQAQSFTKDIFSQLRIIGQLDNKFVVSLLKNQQLVILFDQHAVHERVRLEELLKEYRDMTGDQNHLKFKSKECDEKLMLPVTEPDTNILIGYKNAFQDLGLQYTCFNNMVEVTHVPSCIHNKFLRMQKSKPASLKDIVSALIRECINTIMSTRGVVANTPTVLQNIINLEACRGAIKFGDKLTIRECEEHIKGLSGCSLPFQCAHGRPTLVPIVRLMQSFEVEQKKPNLYKLKENNKD